MFKTRLDTSGNDFEHFWNFEKILIFLKLSKTRSSMEHWAKKSFRKKYPKTCSKHVWTLLGTILSIFGILKNFDFFDIFRRLDPPWNTGQIFFFEKINPKHVQDTFGRFWERI